MSFTSNAVDAEMPDFAICGKYKDIELHTGKLKPKDKVIEYLILPKKTLILSLSQRVKGKNKRKQPERKKNY